MRNAHMRCPEWSGLLSAAPMSTAPTRHMLSDGQVGVNVIDVPSSSTVASARRRPVIHSVWFCSPCLLCTPTCVHTQTASRFPGCRPLLQSSCTTHLTPHMCVQVSPCHRMLLRVTQGVQQLFMVERTNSNKGTIMGTAPQAATSTARCSCT